ncbi:hypothetical protein NMY22_g10803 [Coprinellus aureogranulatus]|nr:hypothetical protein NMY22_g10803 [Coprinellus aureogranulatus]
MIPRYPRSPPVQLLSIGLAENILPSSRLDGHAQALLHGIAARHSKGQANALSRVLHILLAFTWHIPHFMHVSVVWSELRGVCLAEWIEVHRSKDENHVECRCWTVPFLDNDTLAFAEHRFARPSAQGQVHRRSKTRVTRYSAIKRPRDPSFAGEAMRYHAPCMSFLPLHTRPKSSWARTLRRSGIIDASSTEGAWTGGTDALESKQTAAMEPLRIKDAERCNLWKEEVSTNVVVASLFSAVVTAFLIESQKGLRKDPGQAMLEYLVASKINETAAPFSLTSFPPPEASDIRINTLWSLSLVLSITAVLMGTTALQWVREHQQDRGYLDSQIAFSLLRMQAEALDRWLVPQTFTFISLLLPISGILFLLGLIEFFWKINSTICIWVGVAVALALLFMVFTTVLPTFQAILLFPATQVRRPRSPCPYKSPQAWAFHNLCSPIVKAMKHVLGEQSDKYLRINAQNLLSDRTRDYWVDTLPHGTGILFRHGRRDSWLEHGVAWLYQRDFDYMALDSYVDRSHHYQRLPIPLYDTIRGLLEAKKAAFLTHTDYTDVDHAVGIILSTNEMQGRHGPYGRLLSRLTLREPLEFGIPPEIVVNDFEVLQDEATLRLLPE